MHYRSLNILGAASKNMLLRAARQFSSKGGKKIPPAGHYRSPWKILREEFEAVTRPLPPPAELAVPREIDCLIIGGGLVGSCVAFWIKHLHPNALSVAVVERDPSYSTSYSMLSAGGVRHQFSVPENVQLSLFATDFLRNIKEYLSILGEVAPPDIQFNHHGHLLLASPERAEDMVKNVQMQNELGAKIELLTKDRISERFPWLNTEGVEVASYGLEGEGWFDPWLLIKSLKQKNMSYGVRYIHGELSHLNFTTERMLSSDGYVNRDVLESAEVIDEEGNEYGIRFSKLINCAGPWAGEVARMAKIGEGEGEMALALPVTPRKRFVYVANCPDGPGLDTPYFIDPAGVYFRREGLGGDYICGGTPSEESEPSTDDLTVDFKFFSEAIKPQLQHRVPAFKKLKLKSAWACYHDYNTTDQNLIVGEHPYHRNFIFANGLSGHGVQHSIGVGRGIAELIMEGSYKSIDLTRFEFHRLLSDDLILEETCV